MNNKFYQLESQKQMDIINAGIEYFARFEYKKASTEDIAKSAGTSNIYIELNCIRFSSYRRILKKTLEEWGTWKQNAKSVNWKKR